MKKKSKLNIVRVVVLSFDGSECLYMTVQKDQKQNIFDLYKRTENTSWRQAVCTSGYKVVNLNDKEYNLGASYVKNIEWRSAKSLFRTLVEPLSQLAAWRHSDIVIPSDFREGLEVNAVNAEKTTVTRIRSMRLEFSGWKRGQ